MKKFITIASCLVFLSSCGINSMIKDDPELESFKGILEEQTDTDDYKGTHLLVRDNDNILPMNSLSINLSGNQYLGNMVEVTGVYHPEDEVFEVTNISIVEVLSEDTKRYKLTEYKNANLGFELEYYDSWTVEEGPAAVVFLDPSGMDKILIEQSPFNYSPTSYEDGTTDTPLEAYFSINHPEISYLDTRKIGVDKLDAVLMEKASGYEYYLYRDGLIYKISFIAGSDVTENENLFKQMLSEFRFTVFDDEDTIIEEVSLEVPELDMKMANFESSPYDFKGVYPASWYYAGSRSSEAGVLHHYGFSDESVEDGNELIGLDLLSTTDMPATTVQTAENITNIYVQVNGRVYKFTGGNEYIDLMKVMAAGIESTD